MSGEAEHGKQFARDLCSIRRAREVSLTDIHEATRMAYDLIKRFEHDALIDHPQFNRVYIRLFVRGYATRIGIDSVRALEAFELAMKGKYDGLLAREYLETSGEAPSGKEPEPEPEGSDEAPETSEPKDAASAEAGQKPPAKAKSAPPAKADPKPPAEADPKPPAEADPKPPAEADPKPSAEADPKPSAEADPKPSAEADPKPSAKADPKSPAEAKSAPPASDASEESEESVTMALPPEAPPKPLSKEHPAPAVSPSTGVSVAAPSLPAPSKGSGSAGAGRQAPAAWEGRLDPRWIFVGLLVVVITLVVWNLARAMSAPGEAREVAPSSAPLPASAHATVEASEALGALGALGRPLPDTLAITVAADKGSVAPIRVTLDEDLRRPYWIKRGDTMTFRMGSRIILEQQLDSVTVHVEGMAYPLSTPAGQDSVILTRAALDSWHSSLSR